MIVKVLWSILVLTIFSGCADEEKVTGQGAKMETPTNNVEESDQSAAKHDSVVYEHQFSDSAE